jgi:DNA invertase Pin-like site-specific DNA recombinase
MGGLKNGYARNSTDDQTTALQLAALKRARCSHVSEEKGYQEPPATALPFRAAFGRFG